WEGLFAMGDFAHKAHRFAHQNEYQSPASRPGFDVFSLLLSCRHPTTMPIPSPIGVLATVSTSVSQHIPSCDGTSSLPLVCVIPFFAYGFIPLKQSLIKN
ncbi:hypothetical protein, partial [Aeromonas veronii]|uniref:hypothetical protein n=1 Tax=Aeromonas veronii TaxID=654 RepID=UPI001D137176